MGLLDALRARWALAQGEPPGRALRIMVASREERRKIAARKFPGQTAGASVRKTGRAAPGDPVAGLVDAAWYAARHGIAPDAAEAHFRARGLAAAFAPREALAGPDGRHLSGRGAEFLARLGLPLGTAPDKAGTPGADPWAIRNAEGKSLAVVTAIAGPDVRLLPVAAEWAAAADFYVISGSGFRDCGPWRPVRPVFHHPDPARIVAFARTHLHTFFGAYPRVLWVDPDVLLCTDPAQLAARGPLAAWRDEDRSLGAALADAGPEAADALGLWAGHPAFGQPGMFDPSVLLLEPARAGVAEILALWWRHALHGPAAGGVAFTLAAADMPGVPVAALPGGSLGRSADFVRVPA